MALTLALVMWLGTALSCIAMVLAAIFAGKSHRMWQVFSLLFLEFLLTGAGIVFWMFLVWFGAKANMSAGISASIALVLAIAMGIVLAVLTVVASLRLVRAGYAIFGDRERFDVDFGNSLWFRRTGTWRPNDFRQS